MRSPRKEGDNPEWVDRYAPRSLDELVGNASSVKKLSEWLRDWDNVVFRGIQRLEDCSLLGSTLSETSYFVHTYAGNIEILPRSSK